jgi:hypothetical protein
MGLSPSEERILADFANAIVKQAADDYRNALQGKGYDQKKPEQVIKEVLRFFRSEWFRTLTKVDAEYLIEQLNKEHLETEERDNNESNFNAGNTKPNRSNRKNSIHLL